MPDYTKTQIYKIVSKDSSITNFYIGSTTNWTKRKQKHKESYMYEKDKKYHLKIYEIMRENGGFENFNMILVENYPCENKREAEKREQYWKDLLKPDMNMINPYKMEFTKKMNLEEHYKEKYQKYKDIFNKNTKEWYEKTLLKNPDYHKEKYQKNLLKNENLNKEIYQKNLLKNPDYYKEQYIKRSYKVTCECGSEITYCNLSNHKKTLKHIAYEASLNDPSPLTKQITV